MKRLAAAFTILLLILFSSLALARAVKRDTDLVLQPLTQAQSAAEAGDWAAARRLTELAGQHWEKHRLFRHALLPHAELDEISLSFESVRSCLSYRVLPDYTAANRLLMARLRLLSGREQPTPENIF